MPAITQPTHNQSPVVQIADDSHSAESYTYEFQRNPDVVVTGFEPFHLIVVNPSFQIAKALPSSLKSDDGSSIHLAYHPEAIHVGWEAVLKVIPELYTLHSNLSNGEFSAAKDDISNSPFFIHIGAGLPGTYHLETVAHRDGYWRKDVDDKAAPERQNCRGRGYPCEGDKDPLSPAKLETAIDVEGVIKDVRGEVTDLTLPIESSSDAGNFLCDFIFYTSLREARLRYGEAGLNKVLFVHVPPEGKLDEGVKVLSAVIRSIVKRGKARSTGA